MSLRITGANPLPSTPSGPARPREVPPEADPADVAAIDSARPQLAMGARGLLQHMHEDLFTAPNLTSDDQEGRARAYIDNLRAAGPVGLEQPFAAFSNDVRSLYARRGLGLEKEDIVVQGSSVSGQSPTKGMFRFTGPETRTKNGLPPSDIDVAVRVDKTRFHQLAGLRLSELQQEGRIAPDVTLQQLLDPTVDLKLSKGMNDFRNKLQDGILRAYNIPGGHPPVSQVSALTPGRTALRPVSEQQMDLQAGRKVQCSVVMKGGPFDTEPNLPIAPPAEGLDTDSVRSLQDAVHQDVGYLTFDGPHG